MKEKISVLMSVYNAEKYLQTCINSVLNQSYSNFLFYIVNDCSTDNSLAIINSYNDNRIRLINNERNIGLTKSLNKALDYINTEYVARIDADDICEPNRLKYQLSIFENQDENLALVGASAYEIDEKGNLIGEINVENTNLKEKLFFKNTFVHSSVMLRTTVLKEFRFDESIKYAQDYSLWVKIAQKYNVKNCGAKLIRYRIHRESISVLKKKEQDLCVLPTINYQLKKIGIKNDVKRAKLAKLHFQYFNLEKKEFKFKDRFRIFLYFKNILKVNKHNKIYNDYFNQKLIGIINKEKGILFKCLKRFILVKVGFR
ncbi:glycosyltransferase [uncultured Lutibacter sp.]|uniref:glycosyltransferase family 2 protein n=1 Tax=uncultured Lutibacter sp. TaxID=437739 RepID=UPI00261EEB23|nr:glycosyltransferase [uncultured Lutibacter sp.]